jgi:hypothetical protein
MSTANAARNFIPASTPNKLARIAEYAAQHAKVGQPLNMNTSPQK